MISAGWKAYEAGETERAKEFIEKALVIAPDDQKHLTQAALIYRRLDDNPNELKALEKVLSLHPDDQLNRIRLGYNLWRTGVRDKAREHFNAAVKWPDISLYDLAPILVYLGRDQEALEAYKKLAEKLKEDSVEKKYTRDSLVYLILGHFLADQPDKAVEWYVNLLKNAPTANTVDAIEGSNLGTEAKEVLKKVLVLTLAQHPELAPKAEGR